MEMMEKFLGSPLSVRQVLLSVLGLGVSYLIPLIFYRLTLHPLAKYPGPLLAKLTTLRAVYYAFIGDMHLDIERCHQKYGTFVRYGPNAIVVNSADGFHDIYGPGKKIKKAQSYQIHGPGNLIGVRDKKYYTRLKKIFSQGFSDAAIRDHEPKVVQQIDSFCEKVSDGKSSEGWSSVKDMTLWCNYLTTDIITKVVFTTSWDLLLSAKNHGVVSTLATVVRLVGVTHQSHWFYRWRLAPLFFPNIAWSLISLRKYTVDIIASSKKVREEDPGIKDVFGMFIGAKDPESVSGEALGFPLVRLNSSTLIVAGSDTSSSALSATLFYLSRHPKAYAKVAHEVRSSFTNATDICAGSVLSNCHYLRASIDEAMRLSPPVAQPLWREVESSGTIIDGQRIPAGTNVGTGLYSLHHSSKAFPDPYTYDIERWILPDGASEEEIGIMKDRHRHFAPFSVGPRQCLAKNFAIMELLLTMANVFLRMEFKAARGEERIGGGGKGEGLGREREDEFQLRSYFTSHTEGPMIVFKRREGVC